jgi:hypothetical protein
MASFTPSTVGESPEWASIVDSAEENTATFCKALSGKPLFSALHSIYTVTLGELKTMLKKSAPGQKKETPNSAGPPSAQDNDFHKVRRRKRQSTSETDCTSKEPVPATPEPKEVPTRNFFAPLWTTNMETESPCVEASMEEEAAPQKTCRPPPVFLTSPTNLIQLLRQLKNVIKDDFEFRSTWNGTRVVTKGIKDFEAVKTHFSNSNLSY